MSGLPGPEDVATWLARISASQGALMHQVEGLSEGQARGNSLLPGWTRGHVLAHLARHADATARMAVGARERRQVEQYVGGGEGRASEIEEGAGASADRLVGDLESSGDRCLAALRDVDPEGWTYELTWSGTSYAATRMLVSRWREVEIHRVDLELGHGSEAWSDDFIETYLPTELDRLPERAPGTEVPAGLTDHQTLAWLLGRGSDALPALPAWA